jgi:DNA-binding IclR family transcriptional regulator
VTERARSTPTVGSVSNAIAVLRAFARQPEWGVTELARELDLHKSVVHRLLHTLAVGGMLEQEEHGTRYAVGIELARLARQADQRNSVTALARLQLAQLVQETGDSATLAVLRGRRGLYADIVDGTHPIRFAVDIGDTLQLHAGGGKALLAFQGAEFVDDILSRPLHRYTETTITDPDLLREELETVRERGYAFSDGEVTSGSRGVAAPVFDHRQQAIAALVVTTPTERMPESRVPYYRDCVIAAAQELSVRLGYRPGRQTATG